MMASRLARRVLTQSVRPAPRAAAPTARRFASTGAGHATKQASDMPWIVRHHSCLPAMCSPTRVCVRVV